LHYAWAIPRVLAAIAGVALAVSVLPDTAAADSHRFGVMVDAGLPDGVTGAVAYHPVKKVRLHAGVGHNLIGFGVRSGASVRFMDGKVAPMATLEVGRYFRTDAGILGSSIDVGDDEDLEEIGYDYVSALGGIDISGRDKGFYLQLGVSKVYTDLFFVERMGEEVEVRSSTSLDFVTLSGRLGWFVLF
jgi:hypothetical protein